MAMHGAVWAMANKRGDAGPDETPARAAPAPGPDATQPAGGEPIPGSNPLDSTAPTIPIFLAHAAGPRLGQLSAQERGVAPPRGLSGMTRNMRLTLIALSVLLLVACCTLSWGAVSAIFPPPGAPVAAASNSPTASPASAATATAIAFATDQPGTTPGDDATPTSTLGGSATDTPTPTIPPQPTTSPLPCSNPYCNPWGYNFTPGMVITNPPFPQFCTVFPCIGSPPSYVAFWSQSGFVVQCKDGNFAKNGNFGFIGTCKNHRGYSRTLYQY